MRISGPEGVSIPAAGGRAARRLPSLPAQTWTLALLEAASAVALALSAAKPLSPAAPVRLDVVCAGLLAVAAAGTLVWARRIGERVLLAEAAGGVAVTAALVGSAATAAGTFFSCAGFLWLALWVAAFFPPRRLAALLGVELLGAVLGALSNHDPLRTLAAAATVLVIAGLAAAVLSHVVGALRREARYDHLTGLLNRHGIYDALGELEWRRRTDRPTSLVVIDLDGLKEVNDRDGHLAGDRMLATLATELSAAVRSGDVTARIGGDEFLVVLPGTAADEATRWATATQAGSRSPWSFGVAERRLDEAFDAWLGRADRSLYAAKAVGRGRRPLPFAR